MNTSSTDDASEKPTSKRNKLKRKVAQKKEEVAEEDKLKKLKTNDVSEQVRSKFKLHHEC